MIFSFGWSSHNEHSVPEGRRPFLDQTHRIPLKGLVCISEKTFLHLKNVFDGLLPPRRWARRLRRSRPTPAVSAVGKVYPVVQTIVSGF